MSFIQTLVYKFYFYFIDYVYFFENMFSNKKIKNEDNIVIKNIWIYRKKRFLENNDEITKHITFLNQYFLKYGKLIDIGALFRFIEKQGLDADGFYIIWEFLDNEYITHFDNNIRDNNTVYFPAKTYAEYKNILKQQEELFSNGILIAVDDEGNNILDELKKYAGPLENFRMYSHTDKFPFNKIILGLKNKNIEEEIKYLFEETGMIKITDKELNDFEITGETEIWQHNEAECEKKLDDLFKQSATHNIEIDKIEELASQSSFKDMFLSNYYVKMMGCLYHRAFQSKLKKE